MYNPKVAIFGKWQTKHLRARENERLCRKTLDEKPFVMSYDMRQQFKTRPWHWMAWRSLRMAQIERMEASE